MRDAGDRSAAGSEPEARPGRVTPFVVWAYALTWVLLAPFFYALNVKYGGSMHAWMWAWVPFAFVGGWGPTTAALILTARSEGRPGVRRLLRSVSRWRVSFRWYLLVFVFPPLMAALSLLVKDRGFETLRGFDARAALAAAPAAYLLALPFGPLGEEPGWRGFALPRLLERHGAVRASLVLGVIWTFWHIPMMLWSPGAAIPSFMELSAFSIVVFLVQITSETVLMTWLFLRTGGSLLMAVLAHLTFNTAETLVYGGLPDPPAGEERSAYLIHVTLLAVISLAVLWRLARWRVSGRALSFVLPVIVVLAGTGCSRPDTAAKKAAEPMPSWNDSPTKDAILMFVERATRQDSPELIPAPRRIAVFGGDGCLWSEPPHPGTDPPGSELIYQPMLELLGYLRGNGFKIFIVTGGDIEFLRRFSGETLGIPPEQVLETSAAREQMGEPVFAAGSSDGDTRMLEWATSGGGLHFGMLVHHTDPDRERARDRGPDPGRLGRAFDEAPKKGWFVLDMKNDWKVLYPGD